MKDPNRVRIALEQMRWTIKIPMSSSTLKEVSLHGALSLGEFEAAAISSHKAVATAPFESAVFYVQTTSRFSHREGEFFKIILGQSFHQRASCDINPGDYRNSAVFTWCLKVCRNILVLV